MTHQEKMASQLIEAAHTTSMAALGMLPEEPIIQLAPGREVATTKDCLRNANEWLMLAVQNQHGKFLREQMAESPIEEDGIIPQNERNDSPLIDLSV